MRRGIHWAFAACLLLVTSSKAAPTQPETEPATEDEMDRQIGDMLQKLESAKNLNPREKRAVNVLSGLLGGGGGGGGNFLNELNKGPTYSQLLGGGGGFNKAGLLSGFLGSSSGTAVFNRRPLVSLSVGGGAGIIDDDAEAVALRFNVDQLKEHSPLDLGGPQGGVSAHLSIPLRGPIGNLFTPPPLPPEDYDVVDEDYESEPGDEEYDEVYDDVRNSPLGDENQSGSYPPESPDPVSPAGLYPQEAPEPNPSGGIYPQEAPDPQPPSEFRQAPIASQRPRKQKSRGRGRGGKRVRGGRGGRFQKNGNGGASAGASVSDGLGGADASAGAAAGGGSDSGSILSLVTPLLGSSSAGAAGGGTDGGAGVGVSLGGGGGGGANAADLWKETMALHYRIKSFIFRKLAQLLGSSSGSPQAG